MRKLFTLCLLVFTLSASAQWQQTGSKVRYVNGLGIPTKDTAAGVAADSSQILIRPADSSLYVKYKRTWVKVGGGTVSGTTNYIPKFTSSTAIGNSQIFDNGTNVGIGTTSPSEKLHLVGNAFRQNDASNSFGYTISTTSATTTLATLFGGSSFGIRTGGSGSDNMRINSTGDVGIGTASPANKLDVFTTNRTALNTVGSGVNVNYNGSATGEFATIGFSWASSIGNNSTQWGMGMVGTNYSSGTAALNFFTNGNDRMRITSGGNALIGTTTDNGVDKLQVSGSAIATTLKVNTSGQTVNISSYYNGGTGKNIWIGGGGLNSTSAAIESVSIGVDALLNNTSGYYNTAVGKDALKTNTSGYVNDAYGFGTLSSNTTGYRNVSFGAASLSANTTGFENMAIGHLSLVANTTGAGNVGIGAISIANNTTGSSNIALGRNAGTFISGGGNLTTPSQSIFIGEDTRASANGNTNEMIFGHTTIGQGSNTVILGNSSITKTFLRGNTMVNTTTDNGVDELQVNGSISGIGFKQAYVTKTGAYTATNDDYVIDCTSGTFTVTLPASSGRTGRILIIKNSGAGTITVDGNASETIDGAATYSLSVQYATVQIISDGTNWKIIAKF